MFDIVGNVEEWVADWADRLTGFCTDWTTSAGIAGSDLSCFGGDGHDAFDQIPGALIRGGDFLAYTSAGVFAVNTSARPSESTGAIGFRCAR